MRSDTRPTSSISSRWVPARQEEDLGRGVETIPRQTKHAGSGAGTPTYLLADQLGSTVGAIDSVTGAVTSQKYWPYGGSRSGAIAQTDKAYTAQQQEDTGALQDATKALGLYFYHARFYSTTTGRFVSADTVTDGLNRYAYVHNNPLGSTDPSGHDCIDWIPNPRDCGDNATNALSAAVDVTVGAVQRAVSTLPGPARFVWRSYEYGSNSNLMRRFEDTLNSTLGDSYQTKRVDDGARYGLAFKVSIVVGCTSDICNIAAGSKYDTIVVGHTVYVLHDLAWIQDHMDQWAEIFQRALDRIGEYEDLGDFWLKSHVQAEYLNYFRTKPSDCGFDAGKCAINHGCPQHCGDFKNDVPAALTLFELLKKFTL